MENEILYSTKFLQLKAYSRQNGSKWVYAHRPNAKDIAVIVPVVKKDDKDNRALVLDKMLKNLEIENSASFSTGRFYTFFVSAIGLSAAREKVEYICKEILSNPVVEKYEILSIEALK